MAQLDRLGLDEQLTWDPPPKDLVRPLLRQVQWLSGQWANPFRVWCTADLLAVDLAIAFVKWSRDFNDPGRWRALFDLREQLGDDAKAGRRPHRIGEEIRLISNGAEGGKVPACPIRSL